VLRRGFLAQISSVLGAAMVSRTNAAGKLASIMETPGITDQAIVAKVFASATAHGLSDKQIGDVMIAVGSSFIGTPYVAHALEVPGPEHLVVNLRGLDCTTFVESVLALSRCVKLKTPNFEEFQSQLQKIRYRDGLVQGYPSRLHYFNDWIGNNVEKKTVLNVTHDIGGVDVTKPNNFMSMHRNAYKQLSDEANIGPIVEMERRLSSTQFAVITKQRIEAIQGKIQNGDILGLVTSVQGLDIAHVGLATKSHKIVHFLHAPLSDGAVELSVKPLSAYLAGRQNITGIVVVRPLNP
jgi:cell wall-associated NlpC family hydrolase